MRKIAEGTQRRKNQFNGQKCRIILEVSPEGGINSTNCFTVHSGDRSMPLMRMPAIRSEQDRTGREGCSSSRAIAKQSDSEASFREFFSSGA